MSAESTVQIQKKMKFLFETRQIETINGPAGKGKYILLAHGCLRCRLGGFVPQSRNVNNHFPHP